MRDDIKETRELVNMNLYKGEQPTVINTGISVFTVCMNRNENLYESLKTWVACPSIDEIIILDWSSNNKIQYDFFPKKVKIFRVEGQKRWHLSKAFNLSARLTSNDKICKLDSDYKISKDFFIKHRLKEGTFFAGNESAARNENERYLNGCLYINREDFFKVNGYNENINSYGYDDTDLYDRLELSGLSKLAIDLNEIRHIAHKDSVRLNTKSIMKESCEESIKESKIISQENPWSTDSKMSAFYHHGKRLIQRPTLITSIPPHNLKMHKECIDSWVLCGFDVLSLNEQDEIKRLEDKFPNVQFIASKNSNRKHFGKPLVYIDEMIDVLRNVNTELVGICNSDIYINSPMSLQFRMQRLTKDSLVVLQRVDVDSKGNKKLYKDGFDFFLLQKKNLDLIPKSKIINEEPGLCMGMPWWDYLIPLSFLQMDKKIIRIVTDRGRFLDKNIIFHRDHEANWNPLSYMYFNRKFLELMEKVKMNIHAQGPAIIQEILKNLSVQEI
tara:strand:- start:8615 stop:10114 length:1500 start_codon:yes stop_codon:yes gene_type:complete